MSMRKATLDDLDQIFKMVWDNVAELTTGIPDTKITKEYLKILILGTFGDGVWCSNNCDAAMGYSITPDGFSKQVICYGLFLVSSKHGSGFKLAREVFSWVQSQGYEPNLIARPKMEKFYGRIGMRPKEYVFAR